MPDAVMVFAAGLGTRMAPLTDTTPKPMVRVAGRPLIDHALDLVRAASVSRCVVNLHYLADQLRDHLKGQSGLRFSDETDRVLETGGGLRKARDLLGEGPVFTLNSDAVWSDRTALAHLRRHWDPETMSALLLLVPPSRAHGYAGTGDFMCDSNGRLHRGGPLIYSGAQIIDPSGLSAIDQDVFSLNLYWTELARKGRLFGVEYPGHWADVGTPGGITIAETMLRSGS